MAWLTLGRLSFVSDRPSFFRWAATEWQRIGNQIEAALIFTRADFVNVHHGGDVIFQILVPSGIHPPLPPIALHTALSYSRSSAAFISASGIPCFTNAAAFSVHMSNVIRSRAFACATQPQLFERPLSRFCAMTTLALPHNVQRIFQYLRC